MKVKALSLGFGNTSVLHTLLVIESFYITIPIEPDTLLNMDQEAEQLLRVYEKGKCTLRLSFDSYQDIETHGDSCSPGKVNSSQSGSFTKPLSFVKL